MVVIVVFVDFLDAVRFIRGKNSTASDFLLFHSVLKPMGFIIVPVRTYSIPYMEGEATVSSIVTCRVQL